MQWNIPYDRNPLFTGREDIFRRLHAAASSRKVLASSGEALVGPSGIGKTHIAIEYVYRYGDNYQMVFWVNAPKGMGNNAMETLIVSLQTSSKWLLVLDQMEDLALVEYLASKMNKNGHILATSLIPVPRLTTIPVPPFSEEEAALCLLRYRGVLGPGEQLTQTATTAQWYAIEIARLLEGVPRALALAAQYMKSAQVNLLDYRNEVYQKQYVISPLKMIISDHLQTDQHVVYFEGDYPEIYVGRIKDVLHYEWGEVMEGKCTILADVTLLKADDYRYLEMEFFHTYLQRAVVPAPEVFYQWPDSLPPQKFEKHKWPGHEVKIRLRLDISNITYTSSEDFVDHENQ